MINLENKTYKIGILVFILTIIIGVGIFYVYSKYFYSDKYQDLKHIGADKILSQSEQDYFVYVFMDECPDCKTVSGKIRTFNKNVNLYAVDADDVSDLLPVYDWKEHRANYDVVIGKKMGNEVEYFSQKEKEKYLSSNEENEMGHKMRYVEKVADAEYLEKNPNAKINFVYASLKTPFLDYSNINKDTDICIAGYPTLFHIVNGIIAEYYFDAPEVSVFIEDYLKEGM